MMAGPVPLTQVTGTRVQFDRCRFTGRLAGAVVLGTVRVGGPCACPAAAELAGLLAELRGLVAELRC